MQKKKKQQQKRLRNLYIEKQQKIKTYNDHSNPNYLLVLLISLKNRMRLNIYKMKN